MSLLSDVWGPKHQVAHMEPKIAALLEQLAVTLGGFEVLPMKLTGHDIYACSKFVNPNDMFSGMAMKAVYRELMVNTINRNGRTTRVSCRALTNSDITQLGLAQNRPIEYFLLSNEATMPPQRKFFCIQPSVDFVLEIRL